jgi:hypothetical protein
MKQQELGGGVSERERIREIFNGHDMDLRALAEKCKEVGVWDETQIENMAMTGAMRRCKDALKETLDGGELPFASPIEKGTRATWRQREMFTLEDYTFTLSTQSEAWLADHAKMRAWQDECMARYGEAPAIPEIR